MLAAIFDELRAPLVLRDTPDPTPGPCDIIIKVRACGVCGSDLHAANRKNALFGRDLPAGSILGHEFAGDVADVGSDIGARWKAGDKVAAMPVFACGACDACRSGRPLNCRDASFIGLAGAPGAFAHYVRACGHRAVRLPDDMDHKLGALIEPLAVALRAINLAAVSADDRVLIVGAGPIGLALALLCRHVGARHIVTCDLISARAWRGLSLGATSWIDASSTDVRRAFRATAGGSPTVIFDAAGGEGGLQRAMDIAGANGRIVVLALHETNSAVSTLTGFAKELTISFAKAYSADDFQTAADLVCDRLIDPSPMITDVVSLHDFPNMFQRLNAPNDRGKVILDPWM